MSAEHEDPPVEGGYTGVPQKRACNRHEDCDAADAAEVAAGRTAGRGRAYHCHAEDCEDCFGC